ncbi:hypothetical protein COHA_001194 [Chlorella ohadii]|uniref:C2H2-type domain-containing protein n=1 Tax=Chlorella ohadii TaxID=2649997 RepID=A0AAD5H5L9_9CHLO|nr:hypothetical protein COHA_001194 [Chlorella ohadii]
MPQGCGISGMAAEAAVAGPFADIDPSFYLLEASLADLADAAIAVGGYSLPVHSQLLSLQSGVLRELFRGERESGGQSESVVLREPFCAFTVVDVAWFLRLAYCLDEAQAERDLQQMGSCLSAVLRLAHALDAPRLLKKVERHIADKLSSGSVGAIVECIDLAEQCQLDGLYTKCVLRLAARLCTPGGDGDGFSHAASLASMDKGTILLTLGALAEAARRTSQSYGTYGGAPLVAAFLPTEAHLQQVQSFDDRRRCRVCGATFPSRTKLFEHLRLSDHEADTPNPALLDATLRLGRGM